MHSWELSQFSWLVVTNAWIVILHLKLRCLIQVTRKCLSHAGTNHACMYTKSIIIMTMTLVSPARPWPCSPLQVNFSIVIGEGELVGLPGQTRPWLYIPTTITMTKVLLCCLHYHSTVFNCTSVAKLSTDGVCFVSSKTVVCVPLIYSSPSFM